MFFGIFWPIPDCLHPDTVGNPPLFSRDFFNKGGFLGLSTLIDTTGDVGDGIPALVRTLRCLDKGLVCPEGGSAFYRGVANKRDTNLLPVWAV